MLACVLTFSTSYANSVVRSFVYIAMLVILLD